MSEAVLSESSGRRLHVGESVCSLLAIVVVCTAAHGGLPSVHGRVRASEPNDLESSWLAAPTVCADVTACPSVTRPEATVARFSVLPLPLIANVVDVCEVYHVVLARIGGLYGP